MAPDGTTRTATRLCVLVCRDCCCGTERKHPDVDHAAHERALHEAAAVSGSRVIRTRCLGVCERSNVVVVKAARTTFWFGGVLAPDDVAAVTTFIRSGGSTRPPLELSFDEVPRRSACADYSCACGPVKLPA